MRYTQTELDKIMMIGFGRIDNAVESVIEKYCPSPKPESTAFKMQTNALANQFGWQAKSQNPLYGPQSMGLGSLFQ